MSENRDHNNRFHWILTLLHLLRLLRLPYSQKTRHITTTTNVIITTTTFTYDDRRRTSGQSSPHRHSHRARRHRTRRQITASDHPQRPPWRQRLDGNVVRSLEAAAAAHIGGMVDWGPPQCHNDQRPASSSSCSLLSLSWCNTRQRRVSLSTRSRTIDSQLRSMIFIL